MTGVANEVKFRRLCPRGRAMVGCSVLAVTRGCTSMARISSASPVPTSSFPASRNARRTLHHADEPPDRVRQPG
jgi:hypothetical protein